MSKGKSSLIDNHNLWLWVIWAMDTKTKCPFYLKDQRNMTIQVMFLNLNLSWSCQAWMCRVDQALSNWAPESPQSLQKSGANLWPSCRQSDRTLCLQKSSVSRNYHHWGNRTLPLIPLPRTNFQPGGCLTKQEFLYTPFPRLPLVSNLIFKLEVIISSQGFSSAVQMLSWKVRGCEFNPPVRREEEDIPHTSFLEC